MCSLSFFSLSKRLFGFLCWDSEISVCCKSKAIRWKEDFFGAHMSEKIHLNFNVFPENLSRLLGKTDHTVNNFPWKNLNPWAPQTKRLLPALYLGCGTNLKISADKTETTWVIWVNRPYRLDHRSYLSLPWTLCSSISFPLTVCFIKSFLSGPFSLADSFSITSSRFLDSVHVISVSHR